MEKAIEVKSLKKSFEDTEVLKGVDFAVGAFSYPIIFLPFINSAFVPTESTPRGSHF